MSEVYRIYGLGAGFPFGKGISSLEMLITFTDFDRLVVEPIYKNEALKKETKVKGYTPYSPDNESQILQDSFMLFAPTVFREIKNYSKLVEITAGNTFFEMKQTNKEWEELREAAEPIFKKLNIFKLVVD